MRRGSRNKIAVAELNKAIGKKDREKVKELIEKGEKADEDSLGLAIAKDKEIVKFLLDAGIKPNRLAFNQAIKQRDKGIMKLLLDNKGKPVEDNFNFAIALSKKNKEMVDLIKMMIKGGGKPTRENLASAIKNTEAEVVKVLLSSGLKADVNHLDEAIKKENKEIIKMLLGAGTKPTGFSLPYAIHTGNKEIMKWVLDAGAKADRKHLGVAIHMGDKDAVRILLDAGVPVDDGVLEDAEGKNNKEIIKMVEDAMGKRASCELKEVSVDINKVADKIAKQITSGHEHMTIRGSGWTEEEAFRDAMDSVQDEYGNRYGFRELLRTKQVSKPKLPKKVKIEKTPVRKGPVKKYFKIDAVWSSESDRVTRDSRYTKQYDKQGDVLKAAKALALEYGVSLAIYLEAVCQGNTQLATLRPEKGKPGEWAFTCDFHV